MAGSTLKGTSRDPGSEVRVATSVQKEEGKCWLQVLKGWVGTECVETEARRNGGVCAGASAAAGGGEWLYRTSTWARAELRTGAGGAGPTLAVRTLPRLYGTHEERVPLAVEIGNVQVRNGLQVRTPCT